MASNLSGNTYVNTDTNTNDIGFYITPNKNCSISAVVKSSLASASTVNIYDSSKSLIASASFSSDTATLSTPLAVTSGSNYYVTVSASTRAFQTSPAYPRARTDITYTANAFMTSAGNPSTLITGIGEDGNILDIQTANAFSLIAAVGTFVLTGLPSLFRVSLSMIASVGTFALSGLPVIFRTGFGIVGAVGTFILTGMNAVFSLKGWQNQTKNTSTFTDQTKSTSSWTNSTKN